MTRKPIQATLSRQIVEEASEWFVEFRVGEVGQDARARFDEWLRRSPEHIRAYIDIAKTYAVLRPLDAGSKVDVRALIDYARSEENVVSFGKPRLQDHVASTGSGRPRDSGTDNEPNAPVGRIGWPWLAFGLACCAAIVSVVAFLSHKYPSYQTDIGERRSITLADGSTVDLNARAKIRVEFLRDRRTVELIEGQALFDVVKDASRPFIVRSGGLSVKVLGTQFDVDRRRNATTVTVLEGRVAVQPTQGDRAAARSPDQAGANSLTTAQGKGRAPVLVAAGEQVVVTGEAVPAPQRADVQAATAWLQRRLVFDGSRLADVADDFNRYNSRQIIIADPDLEEFHISGVYSSTDPGSLIRFLQSQPGIAVTMRGDSVRIERK